MPCQWSPAGGKRGDAFERPKMGLLGLKLEGTSDFRPGGLGGIYCTFVSFGVEEKTCSFDKGATKIPSTKSAIAPFSFQMPKFRQVEKKLQDVHWFSFDFSQLAWAVKSPSTILAVRE